MSGQILIRAPTECARCASIVREAQRHHLRHVRGVVPGLREAQADAAVRVVLLGRGRRLLPGNDLNDFSPAPVQQRAPCDGLPAHAGERSRSRCWPHPRQTVGIGVTLLLHCDLVVAARTAQLSMPFVSLGLVPEAASSLLLPRLVGQQRAAELLYLGKPFDAATAERLGLVNRVVEEARSLPRPVRLRGRCAAAQRRAARHPAPAAR